jgi:hypothetical protein
MIDIRLYILPEQHLTDLTRRLLRILKGILPVISGASCSAILFRLLLFLWDLFVSALVDFVTLVIFSPASGLTVVFGFESGCNITVRLSSALSAGVP